MLETGHPKTRKAARATRLLYDKDDRLH